MLAISGIACEQQNEENDTTNEPLTFEIEISSLTWDTALVLIYPSNDEDTFYFDIFEKATYE